MKTPIKFSYKSFGKLILSIIWTGMFILVSCVIVKGSSAFEIELAKRNEIDENNKGDYEENKNVNDWLENMTSGLLEQGSSFLGYGNKGITEVENKEQLLFGFGWNLAEYLEEKRIESTLAQREDSLTEAEEILLQQEILQKDFPFLAAEGYYEDETTEYVVEEDTKAVMAAAEGKIKQLRESLDTNYLLQNFYIVDSTTSVDNSVFQVKKLLEKDMTLKKKGEPQILIYHTHGKTEGFVNKRTGKMVSVIEVGERLAEILEEDYGYEVIHDETPYDMVNGSVDRNQAYNQSLDGVKKTLEKYPSIQVIIDLHRDGIGSEDRRTTVIDGKTTAKFMLFNGLSRNKEGVIDYLYNPKLEGNLAFSLQLKLKAMELYPTITRPNYLKGYRYNLHLREKSLLIELGNQNNSSEEAMNALEPMAEILDAVLQGK